MDNDNNTLVLASFGQRLINYIIDSIIISSITLIIASTTNLIDYQNLEVLNPPVKLVYITYPCTFIYYFIFELFLNKTPGKFISKTRVVTLEGERPEIKTLIIRSATRLLDFIYIISFLFLMPRQIGGLHDLLSKTRVIDEVDSGY